MEAQDIMTRNVVTVSIDATAKDVARLLVERHVSAVPVVDGEGDLVGIVSEGDLVRRPEIAGEKRPSWWLALVSDPGEQADEYIKTRSQQVSQIMSKHVVSVGKTTAVAEIARLLEEKRIKRVPVVTDGRLVGIVSRADLLRAMAVKTEMAPPAERKDDRAIQAELQRILQEQHWSSQLLNVVVEDGVVHLWGIVDQPEMGEALKVAAQNIAGVSSVETHFAAPPTWA